MPLVVDASMTLTWCFEDEATPITRSLLRTLERDEGVVPAIWPYEVANGIAVGERRGRLSLADAEHFFTFLAGLPISVEPATIAQARHAILPLARQFRLSVYDAAYLELALRTGFALASQDAQLKVAATSLGVPLAE